MLRESTAADRHDLARALEDGERGLGSERSPRTTNARSNGRYANGCEGRHETCSKPRGRRGRPRRIDIALCGFSRRIGAADDKRRGHYNLISRCTSPWGTAIRRTVYGLARMVEPGRIRAISRAARGSLEDIGNADQRADDCARREGGCALHPKPEGNPAGAAAISWRGGESTRLTRVSRRGEADSRNSER